MESKSSSHRNKRGEEGRSERRMSITSSNQSKSSLKTLKSSASKLGVSGSRRNLSGSRHSDAPSVAVFDDEGNNITPQSLLTTKPSVLKKERHTTTSSSKSGQLSPPSEEHSSADFGSSAISQSGWTSDHSTPTRDDESGTETPPPADADKETQDVEQATQPEVDETVPLTDAQLESVVRLQLVETNTFWLLELPGTCVATETPEHETVTAANAEYEAMLKSKAGNDRFMQRGMQTLNAAVKNKDVQATPVPTADASCEATLWDLYDNRQRQLAEAKKEKKNNPLQLVKNPEPSRKKRDAEAAEEPTKSEVAQLLLLEQLPEALRIVERMVSQNIYHSKHMAYKDLVPFVPPAASLSNTASATQVMGATTTSSSAADGAEKAQPKEANKQPQQGPARALEFLWSFECDLSRGRNVSCMCWNKKKPDLLAVAYGQFEFTSQRDGLILFWSLKNPDYPERVHRVPCGVTALDFSTSHPNLLAAGLYNGTVAVYDVRKPDGKPVVESGHNSGKHLDAVWQVKWVDKGSERGEYLVSISTDGRVTQWSIKKGLEYVDLMKLKKGPSQKSDPNKSEAFISRFSSGLCFDFCPRDPNIYIAGTEDGNIHKCSCSYNEQYLETYFGHTGPVYAMRWSPFSNKHFASCSADWSIRIWDMDKDLPIINFASFQDYVADFCWSPKVSTIFGSVTGDGRVDIWDLACSNLDPVISCSIAPRKPSSIVFGFNAPVVVTGDNNGSVDVYRLVGMDTSDYAPEEQLSRLEKSIAPDDLGASSSEAT